MIDVVREDFDEESYEHTYTYYFYGTLTGTRYFTEEDYEEPLTDREILSYETEIEEAIARYDEGDPNLATYYNDPDIKVDSIDIGVKAMNGRLFSCAKVVTLEELRDDRDIEDLRDWLTGQYSDGWGEGFEQHPIESYEDQYDHEEYYEDEDGESGYETETDYQRVDVCIHFWDPNMKPLRFERG